MNASLHERHNFDAGGGCPRAAFMTSEGKLVVAKTMELGLRPGERPYTEVVLVDTPSGGPAATGWPMPYGGPGAASTFVWRRE
jgi:hypothetical protein